MYENEFDFLILSGILRLQESGAYDILLRKFSRPLNDAVGGGGGGVAGRTHAVGFFQLSLALKAYAVVIGICLVVIVGELLHKKIVNF